MVKYIPLVAAKQGVYLTIFTKLMDTKNQKADKEEKHSGAEKPVSLWGASFAEVLGALLKTKPMPKEDKKKNESKNA